MTLVRKINMDGGIFQKQLNKHSNLLLNPEHVGWQTTVGYFALVLNFKLITEQFH